MKSILLMLVVIIMSGTGFSQEINWKSLKDKDRHIVNINGGYNFGLIFGAGYGYHINSRLPLVLNLEFSVPSGNKLTEDLKSKAGIKIRLLEVKDFQFSANLYGTYMRYENGFVRTKTFGSDVSGVIGYYRPRWFVAGEFGFEKAIVTNFKHSDVYREIYPDVQDGWYQPSTGGNFRYGLQAGYSLKQHDLYLEVGQAISQDFKTKPMIPYYLQIGYNFKFSVGSK